MNEQEKESIALNLIAQALKEASTILSLSSLELTSLPTEIGALPKLMHLRLQDNQLTSLPTEIGALFNLTELFLGGNQLTSLPKEIGALSNLTELYLQDNQLTSLPTEIGALSNLTELFLGGNQLTSLPKEIGALSNLTHLRLQDNQLTSLPTEIGALSNLTHLYLQDNQLTSLPKEIGALPKLMHLSLQDNQLTSLPTEIGALSNLTELFLGGNQLTSLPKEIGALSNLTQLYLQDNQLTSLPTEIGALSNLTQLYLQDNQLTSLPTEIGALPKLMHLRLQDNQLTSLPTEIGALSNLTELFLGGNQLTSLPTEIGALPKLMHLRLQDNQLTSLPTEIGALSNLTRLYLQDNQLTSLPKEIGALPKLMHLSLQDNQLTSLPTEIGALSNLTELFLGGNQLTSLPKEIGALSNLTHLRLQDNQLTSLPTEIGALSAPAAININRNPLPASLLAASHDSAKTLCTLLSNLNDPKKVKMISEVKLMITGEGNVGKTSLRKALDENAEVLTSEPTTWGVECGHFPLTHPSSGNSEITFNYWDFGGQAVYRVTHQFFFSNDGLYLLLWHPREGEERGMIKDWLDRIHARTAGKAKIILVATHANEEAGENYRSKIDLDRLNLSHGEMIVDQISIDSIDNYNIDKLRQMLVREARDLPGIDNPINISWDEARKEILDPGNEAPWMHFTELEMICRKHGIEDEAAIEAIAATYIHLLGRGIWYGLDWPDDPNLRDTIVRNPTWLSQAFMQLVQHEPTRASGGMLDHNSLRDAWQGHKNKDWIEFNVDEFARLMPILREQRVALPTRGSEGRRSLIPQLIPNPRPRIPWTKPEELTPEAKVIRIRTRLTPDVDGIMAQLVALLEPYHHYELDSECGAFWSDGLFLRDSEGRYSNEALIEFQRERSHALLSVTISGEQPGFLWHQIDRAIYTLEQFWPGLTREDTISCPTRRETFCRGSFEMSDVLQAQAESDPIKCPKCRKMLEGDTLLMGLSTKGHSSILNSISNDMQYFRQREQRPAPRSVFIVPVENTSNWRDIKNWEIFKRRELKAILLSEFSGAAIAEKIFIADQGYLKYIRPVFKIGAAFAGMPIPFDLPDGMGDILGDMSDTMDRIGEYLPDGDNVEESPQSNLYLMRQFLNAIGLDPEAHGMGLERAGDNWYWMSAAELRQHHPTSAVLPNFEE